MSTTDRSTSTPSASTSATGSAADRDAPGRTLRQAAARTVPYATEASSRVARTGRAVAFWLAALLPLTYVPTLVADVATDRPLLLAALVTAHAVTLVLGRGHATDADASIDAR